MSIDCHIYYLNLVGGVNKMAGKIGWGLFLVLFGAGSFILPLMGIQFKLFILMQLMLGAFAYFVSALMVLGGLGLCIKGLMDVKA